MLKCWWGTHNHVGQIYTEWEKDIWKSNGQGPGGNIQRKQLTSIKSAQLEGYFTFTSASQPPQCIMFKYGFILYYIGLPVCSGLVYHSIWSVLVRWYSVVTETWDSIVPELQHVLFRCVRVCVSVFTFVVRDSGLRWTVLWFAISYVKNFFSHVFQMWVTFKWSL